jgi:cysteinyl-tRNA synthetase
MTRQKEEFVPQNEHGVTFYSCGPTVYGEFHVGNARTFVSTDVIRRWLLQRGYHVRYVQNITDIDDKIIARAQKEGTSADAIAEKYTAYFLQRLGSLGNLPADEHPLATKHIGGMIALIRQLETKGHAYPTPDGSVWFDVQSFKEYGKLSQRPLDQMRQGERVDDRIAGLKKSPLDFALWKAAKIGEPFWNSPWGEGRPGWHIECSCMAMRALRTETIDIHAGGVDLIFPHHENEIAQSEAATGKPFARFWIHCGMLDIDGEKMSKSLGNMMYIDDVLAKIDALTLRYFFISARYRDKLDYTEDNLHKCASAAERMVNAARSVAQLLANETHDRSWKQQPDLLAFWNEFAEAMDDDINTPRALGVLAQVVTLLNTRRTAVENGEGDRRVLSRTAALLDEMRFVLGLTESLERQDDSLPPETLKALRSLLTELGGKDSDDPNRVMDQLIARRHLARSERQFAVADRIRSALTSHGILLEDKPTGTVWKKG